MIRQTRLLRREIGLQARHDIIKENADPLRQPGAPQKHRVNFLRVVLHSLRENFHQCAGSKVVSRVIVADPGEPQTCDRHAPDRFPVIGQQGTIDRTIHDASAFLQRPHGRGAAKIETDAIVLGKVIDGHGRAAALQIGGSRHDLAPGRAELARHHAGIGQGADAESHIGAVEIKVDQFVRQGEVDDDIRISREKFRQ